MDAVRVNMEPEHPARSDIYSSTRAASALAAVRENPQQMHKPNEMTVCAQKGPA